MVSLLDVQTIVQSWTHVNIELSSKMMKFWIMPPILFAENLYSQVDSEGRRYLLMDSIIDHKSDKNAVAKDDEFVVVNGKRHRKKTTEGWSFNI